MSDLKLSGSIGPGGPFPILGTQGIELVGNADHVLTTSEAANNYIRVTSDGSLSAVRKVIAPLIEGTEFTVANATTEGFAIEFVGASGNGVVVQPGAIVAVVTDGVNYGQTVDSDDLLANVSVLVFRPGGTAGGNVYVDEVTLSAACVSPQRQVVLEFDLSLVGGTYSFTTVGPLDTGNNTEWTDLGYGYTVKFANGTTLPNLPTGFNGHLTIDISQAETVATLTTIHSCSFNQGASVNVLSGGGTFVKVTGSDNAGLFYFRDLSYATSAGSPTFVNAGTGGAPVLVLNLLDSSYVSAGAADARCTITVSSPGVYVDASLYPQCTIYGLYTDSQGGAVVHIPAASVFGTALIWDSTTGILWSSNGTAWAPVTTQSGRTTLVNGVSPAIPVAHLDANSRIVCSIVHPSGSAIGMPCALESGRTVGASPTFVITSVSLAGATVATDESDVEWTLTQQTGS